MKRVGLALGCFGLVLLTTGCGEKTLECRSSDDSLGVEYLYQLNFDRDDMIDTGVIRQRYVLEDEDLNNFDEMVQEVKDSVEEVDSQGIDIEVTDNGTDTIDVIFRFDIEEVGNALGEELNADSNYDTIKADLENNGFVCE